MTKFNPKTPNWEVRVRNSFNRQHFMKHIGAELTLCQPGEVDISIEFQPELTQQHNFFHGGVTASIADSAAGYAALTLFEAGTGVLTTEFKLNLLNPGKGETMVARGRVIKPGRTLTVCRSDVFAIADGDESHVATGLLTMMSLPGIDD